MKTTLCFYPAVFSLVLLARAARAAPSLSCDGSRVCFSGGFSHMAVLQRSPAAAALYGSVPAGSPAGAAIALTLSASDGSYSKTFRGAAAADLTWKIVLDPMMPRGGGDFSATVACAACAGGGGVSSATLQNLTFGDVLICSGQSKRVHRIQFQPRPDQSPNRIDTRASTCRTTRTSTGDERAGLADDRAQ